MQIQTNNTRLHNTDLLKGLAILFVVITHFSWTDDQRLWLLFPFWIDMAVPIFMIVTGYLSAKSFSRRGLTGFVSPYKPRDLIRRWLRLILPAIPIYIAQLIFQFVFMSRDNGIIWFLTSEFVPGSYYFHIMIQSVLLTPAIFWLVSKYNVKGLLACFIINLCFEVLQTVFHLSPEIYRLCLLRYVFALGYGCYIFIGKGARDKNTIISLASSFIIGILYILTFQYLGGVPIFTKQWTKTSMFVILYVAPLIALSFLKPDRLKCSVLERLGRASYDIYLVQMFFYAYVSSKVYTMIGNPIVQMLASVFLCCGFGYVYHLLENKLTNAIIHKMTQTAN